MKRTILWAGALLALVIPLQAGAQVSISPTEWDFGAVEVGASSTQVFTVTNEMDEGLWFEGYEIQPGDHFRILSGPILNEEIFPGESVEIDVQFAPLSAGSFEAEMQMVVVNGGLHELTVPLSGTGVDAAAARCVGFEPPMASGPVRVKGNRALPFKAQLFDGDNNLVTDLDLTAPPVIQVWYEYGTPQAEDVSEEALSPGQSTDGNQFFFDSDQRWHYNLKTRNYSAAGSYTVFMDSGDASEYLVDPACSGQFVVK